MTWFWTTLWDGPGVPVPYQSSAPSRPDSMSSTTGVAACGVRTSPCYWTILLKVACCLNFDPMAERSHGVFCRQVTQWSGGDIRLQDSRDLFVPCNLRNEICPVREMGCGALADLELCLAGVTVDSRDYEQPTRRVVLNRAGDREMHSPFLSPGAFSTCSCHNL